MSCRLPDVKPSPEGWWFRGVAPSAWEAVAEILEAHGEPWPEEVVIADLAYWTDAAEQGRAPRVPTYRALMRRWAWSEWATRDAMRRHLANSSQTPRKNLAETSQNERANLDNSALILANSSQEPRTDLAETSTRAMVKEEEPEEEEEIGAAGPAPLPAGGRVADPERDGSRSATQALPATQFDPVEIVAAEWWRLWSIRRERHPRGAPRSAALTKEDRAAIRKVVGGKKPKITTDEAIMVCRWAFYGQDFHARHLRGEASEDQAENEHLSPVACYRPGKLGEKLGKARIFIEERERAKTARPSPPPAPVAPIPGPPPQPPPTPYQPPELDPETAERLARIRAAAQHRRRLRTWPSGEPHAENRPADG